MKLRVAGINFDHFHMGDLLRMAAEHPDIEIAGICDEHPERMQDAIQRFGIDEGRVFSDVDECLERSRPDFVILCPATARHAEYVERVAPHKVHLLVEKPFAASVEDADRMIAAARQAGLMMAINWPLRWVASHATAYRLLHEGRIGELQEVHYYDGNRGPLYHGAHKQEITPTAEMKRQSWFYQQAQGGGSLQDYLGYGTTLGTWYHGGRMPTEITAVTDQPNGLDVDEHCIAVARYATGLSKFETRWGTFTDPWTHPPQPACGFVLKGADGTIRSDDYAPAVRLQTPAHPGGEMIPSDVMQPPFGNAIQYFAHCLRHDREPEGPLSPVISRIGQQMVDAAVLSARLKKTVPLVP
jgi:predicted dehydrogenase